MNKLSLSKSGQLSTRREIVPRRAGVAHPVVVQRFESAVLAAALIVAYSAGDFNWWFLAVLFLIPDVSLFFYAGGSVLGARAYNLLHSYIGPLLLAFMGFGLNISLMIAMSITWSLHIACDRALGYGLKYNTHFRHNHLTWK
jgi:hypothetical protein